MSMFSCATMESRGTVGLSVKYSEPQRPFSSPVCHTKMIDRRGLALLLDRAPAIASTDTDPEPSSSAPLLIESSRGLFTLRRLSSVAWILAICSGVGFLFSLSAPAGRMM